jgi:hypothetical protein
MAPTRSARTRLTPALFNLFLCIVIVMQMLGATMSFWTLSFDSNVIESSLLEGVSLLPTHVTLSRIVRAEPYHETPAPLPSILLEDICFRPPNVSFSALSLV